MPPQRQVIVISSDDDEDQPPFEGDNTFNHDSTPLFQQNNLDFLVESTSLSLSLFLPLYSLKFYYYNIFGGGRIFSVDGARRDREQSWWDALAYRRGDAFSKTGSNRRDWVGRCDEEWKYDSLSGTMLSVAPNDLRDIVSRDWHRAKPRQHKSSQLSYTSFQSFLLLSNPFIHMSMYESLTLSIFPSNQTERFIPPSSPTA